MLPEVTELLDAEIAVRSGQPVSVVRMLELQCLLNDAAMPTWAEIAAALADLGLSKA